MENDITQVWFNLGFTALVSALVYSYYRKSISKTSEKYSTFWPRFLAPIIDGLILWPVVVGFNFLLIIYDFSLVISAFLNLSIYFSHYFYTIYLHGKYSQTVGKMVCKIKVVSVDTEEDISFRAAIIRDSIPLVVALILVIINFDFFMNISKTTELKFSDIPWLTIVPFVWFFAEIITMLTNAKRRALHDYIAGTVVIRTNI